jgi:hypothetical protein
MGLEKKKKHEQPTILKRLTSYSRQDIYVTFYEKYSGTLKIFIIYVSLLGLNNI